LGPAADRSPRLGVFDGFRAFALLGVVVVHIFGASGVIAAGRDDLFDRAIWTLLGNTIDFFFIVSGFLLFLPVLRRGGEFGPVRDFYLRRFARIQPEYWLALAVVLAMIVLIPVDFPPPVPSFGSVVIHALDLQTVVRMFDPGFLVGFWIDGALWMIPVIAGLYLVLPLVSGLFNRHIWWGLGLAAAVTVGWKLALTHFPGAFHRLSGSEFTDIQVQIIATDQSPAYAFSFALGMVAATLYLRAERNPASGWVRRGIPLGAAVAVVVYLLAGSPYYEAALGSEAGIDAGSRGRMLIWENLAASASRAMILLAVTVGPVWVRRCFDNRGARWTANQSYGVYLIHLPIAFYAAQLLSLGHEGGLLNFLDWSAAILPLAFVYAWLSRRWVGEPAVNRVRKYLRSRSRSSAKQELRYLDREDDREQ
jgi:peptidoglycan/LPS O-acetylase OafA/YrhL